MYGTEDIGQYATWFESQVQGISIGQPHLKITPSPHVALVHHRGARGQAMASVVSTLVDPLVEAEIGIEEVKEDPRFETGLQDMFNNFSL